MSTKSVVGDNLRRELKKAGMTQTDLADMIGTSRANVSSICIGRTAISLDRIDSIAAALGISPMRLLMCDEDRKAFELGERALRSQACRDLVDALKKAPDRRIEKVAALLLD